MVWFFLLVLAALFVCHCWATNKVHERVMKLERKHGRNEPWE